MTYNDIQERTNIHLSAINLLVNRINETTINFEIVLQKENISTMKEQVSHNRKWLEAVDSQLHKVYHELLNIANAQDMIDEDEFNFIYGYNKFLQKEDSIYNHKEQL